MGLGNCVAAEVVVAPIKVSLALLQSKRRRQRQQQQLALCLRKQTLMSNTPIKSRDSLAVKTPGKPLSAQVVAARISALERVLQVATLFRLPARRFLEPRETNEREIPSGDKRGHYLSQQTHNRWGGGAYRVSPLCFLWRLFSRASVALRGVASHSSSSSSSSSLFVEKYR